MRGVLKPREDRAVKATPVFLAPAQAQRILAALDIPSVLGNRERLAAAAELRAAIRQGAAT